MKRAFHGNCMYFTLHRAQCLARYFSNSRNTHHTQHRVKHGILQIIFVQVAYIQVDLTHYPAKENL
jgi:hypothetical protein